MLRKYRHEETFLERLVRKIKVNPRYVFAVLSLTAITILGLLGTTITLLIKLYTK